MIEVPFQTPRIEWWSGKTLFSGELLRDFHRSGVRKSVLPFRSQSRL